MGLGPPVCHDCKMLMRLQPNGRGPWYCSNCGNKEVKYCLWEYDKEWQKIIEKRTKEKENFNG